MADKNQWLDADVFRTIVHHTPLISIDLLVYNDKKQVLLGKRVNRPAQGMWFVPGGRIAKGERIHDAFLRLTYEELGIAIDIKQASYLGLYEHHYSDSIFTTEDEQISTHYVVNAFKLFIPNEVIPPKVQHNEYDWFTEDELLTSPLVHIHTRWYFQKNIGFNCLG
ncbi:GDP-mannose mannosyl hydrolase [Pectobacterium versatile]|uniref:GDP-mannose mannosyl hydrolase n=1 Tax=Pectobacterium versatile TaxID=2488639 RepID=UPI000B7BB459|nr:MULTISPECIES: GDP-mannose mannosyl hydrolase [Pectobacterium]ASN86348.1 GDP-mannose mannosyl hydrolase [Pectobacterium versatile]